MKDYDPNDPDPDPDPEARDDGDRHEVPCPYCRGKGYQLGQAGERSTAHRCPDCDGTGTKYVL